MLLYFVVSSAFFLARCAPTLLCSSKNPTASLADESYRACLDLPVAHLREFAYLPICEVAGPTNKAVISRYHRIGGYDWLAIPLILLPILRRMGRPSSRRG